MGLADAETQHLTWRNPIIAAEHFACAALASAIQELLSTSTGWTGGAKRGIALPGPRESIDLLAAARAHGVRRIESGRHSNNRRFCSRAHTAGGRDAG